MSFLVGFFVSIISILFGFYILFAGRHAIWATLGIIGLSAAGNILAVLAAGGDSGRDLIEMQKWDLVIISFLVGALGIVLGIYKEELAVLSIGFIAGADAALWFYDVTTHLMTNLAKLSEQSAYITGIIIIITGGMLGLGLVRATRDEALILITMLVGTQLILDAFGFSPTSSWTAIIMITLALAGVLVQYAVYLREIKSDQLHPQPHPSSLAYFQDLELDL